LTIIGRKGKGTCDDVILNEALQRSSVLGHEVLPAHVGNVVGFGSSKLKFEKS
jgi:hypothetical protein